MTTTPQGDVIERAAKVLYECEKRRGEHASEILEVATQAKAAGVLLIEPWEEAKQTFLADAAALASAGLLSQGWLPIEGAPKDGTRVILFTDHATFKLGFWLNDRWESMGFPDNEYLQTSPTHWMPLPPPPGAK